jgi:hypothetical protein
MGTTTESAKPKTSEKNSKNIMGKKYFFIKTFNCKDD